MRTQIADKLKIELKEVNLGPKKDSKPSITSAHDSKRIDALVTKASANFFLLTKAKCEMETDYKSTTLTKITMDDISAQITAEKEEEKKLKEKLKKEGKEVEKKEEELE
eukprot:CAMPEP_0116899326 /NCGR_PEP_ID=MMETSP0467-20121206/7922_1 /TAXON_ID=283647 /ORGANISM="Mesodinium pulex, Strain SPMC105" /LENGTH=108 /DNA_ID=CAMNT_0004572089 /DNA_START=151 /DNA_END=477 /DNA_ORIENTATION=+